MRILITGSRKWQNKRLMDEVLYDCWKRSGARNLKQQFIIRHGKAKHGADLIADVVAKKMIRDGAPGIVIESFPADWQHANCIHPQGRRSDGVWYCKVAGHHRNQRMIDAGGISEVHAFVVDPGGGTADCVRRALSAKLKVVTHGESLEYLLG